MSSKTFRNNPLFLRNEFETEGKWGFPIIKKQQLDVIDIELMLHPSQLDLILT